MCFSGSVAKVRCQMWRLLVCLDCAQLLRPLVQSGKELMVSSCSAVGLLPTLTPAEQQQKKNWVNWVKSALNSPTNRSHHVTKVRRRRIKHLYEVSFNKKRSTFVKKNKWWVEEKNLCIANTMRRYGCTVCFEASACFKLLTISKLWSAYLRRTHTHTLWQLLFPHVAAIPLSLLVTV